MKFPRREPDYRVRARRGNRLPGLPRGCLDHAANALAMADLRAKAEVARRRFDIDRAPRGDERLFGIGLDHRPVLDRQLRGDHRQGGSLMSLQLAHADRVGAFHGLRPAMAVTQWTWVKP